MLEEEKSMFKRKILFVLLLLMNEAMIRLIGEEYFLNFKIGDIGKVLRWVIVVFVVLSVLYYIKERAIVIEK